MLDFKKILIPYDGSSHAKKALNQAISLRSAQTAQNSMSQRF